MFSRTKAGFDGKPEKAAEPAFACLILGEKKAKARKNQIFLENRLAMSYSVVTIH